MGPDGARSSSTYESGGPDLDSVVLEERLVGYLDPGGEEALRVLNSVRGIWTTSSCLGRITIIEGEWPWERREETRIVYKSHLPIDPAAVALAASRPFENLWLKVTGPILHFRAQSQRCAEALLRLARESGFKHSGIITLAGREGCCVVEVIAPTEVSVPLKLEGRLLLVGGQLEVVVGRVNRALEEGRRRLSRLLSLFPSLTRHCP